MKLQESKNIYIGRYKSTIDVTSSLDPFEDIIALITGLISPNYITTVIKRKRPRMSNTNSEKLGKKIIPYIKIALEFIDQAKSGSPNLSFLPYYYAILNLMKAYTLLGYNRNEFDINSHQHGVIFNKLNTDRKAMLKHAITFKKRGVLPLFYKTLTGHEIRNNTSFRVDGMFNKIVSISAEYNMATDLNNPICTGSYRIVENNGFYQLHLEILNPWFKRKPRLLMGLKITNSEKNILMSSPISINTTHLQSAVRALLNTSQCYRIKRAKNKLEMERILFPYNFSKYQIPEEIPIVCSFYYMSSVVRYQPIFYQKLMDSEFNPMLIALRRHGIYTFMQLFWSYFHNMEIHINRD